MAISKRKKRSVLWTYLVGMVWFLIFWAGLNFLCGLFVGFGAGTGAASGPDGILRGGRAATNFTMVHDRLIMFFAGLCVAIGMSRGVLPGARPAKSENAEEIRKKVIAIQRDGLRRIEELKRKANNPKRAS